MKNTLKTLTKDAIFITGISLIALSFLLYVLSDFLIIGDGRGSNFSFFIASYIISIVYFIIIWAKKIKKLFFIENWANNLEYGFLHLILCLISAYSLNKEIPVFEQSTGWMQILLVIQGVVLILMFVKDSLPRWAKIIMFAFMGVGFMLFLYLSIYLIPLYPIGVVGFFVLGISLHAFVPLWFTGTLLLYLLRSDNRNKETLIGFFSGAAFSVIVVTIFLIEWGASTKALSRASDRMILEERSDMPEWVMVAQNMPKNSISEKILKSGLVYSAAPEHYNWDFFDFPSRSFDEVRKHDPLVMIATFFYGRPSMDADDRIKVLEAMYDSRHHAQERLWSGDNLKTSHVISNVRIYPNLRLAYTEKIVSIRNNDSRQSWNPTEEAIYTFHLPEGAVVTSLSLWINGKEEKGVLTAKRKADSAYTQIVGYEVRDPSLIRWQEGNTVSVRVFPCTPSTDRKFKIGITSPLRKSDNELQYNNIWFDGPACAQTNETVKLQLMDEVTDLDLPVGFDKIKSNTYFYEGNYKADWNLSLTCPALKANNFSFDGKSYKIEDYKKAYKGLNLQNIYLDINSSWDEEEFLQIVNSCKDKNIYVYTDKLIKLTNDNRNELFEELKYLNFSIFPFYEIKSPQTSLVVTKGTLASPNLSDLKNTEFSSQLQAYLKADSAIKLFNIGEELSPYIKTLKELRVFEYDNGDVNYLTTLIKENKYTQNPESDSMVVINEASIKISESAGTAPSNAPDHLMRLFSYNNVMYQTGKNYLNPDFYDENIVNKAYKAYVVSPSTSLVVLETQEDYKRFGIKDEGTSLKNASMKSSGAVPEPHEWLLIVLLVGFMAFLYIKNK
jgi:XrtN system VIT domain protein